MAKQRITIKSLSRARPQRVYDFIVDGLRRQGKRSMLNSNCVYRRTLKSGEVLRCAAGLLVSDDEYDESNEGKCWNITTYSADSGDFKHTDLILALQDVHDGFTPSLWERQFKRVANSFGLKYSPAKKK